MPTLNFPSHLPIIITMMAYSNPEREDEPTALPDVEIFYMSDGDMTDAGKDTCWCSEESGNPLDRGWYYWSCSPGCLPDSDPAGPFKTKEEAIAAAQL